MNRLHFRDAADCRWDLVGLGEVMLRLDPGEGRIHTTRAFNVWEGGGEYNVARGLRRCFGHRTAIATALVDNPVGRLVEDLMLQGGVDTSLVRWLEYDGMGRAARNGLNFTERGFGPRAAVGCSDRGHTAVGGLRTGEIDFDAIFRHGARVLHTGGIFAGLSATTPEVADEALRAARGRGTVVSYDLNYRPSLWKAHGGRERAREVNQRLVGLSDILFGNEEDFSVALGFEVEGADSSFSKLDSSKFRRMIEQVAARYPNLSVIATSMRTAHSASLNGWGGILWAEGKFYEVPPINLEILDRVGGGDSFASGLLHGLLADRDPEWCLRCAVAHGALAMSTPGDTSTASLAEVLKAMAGGNARIER